MKSISVRRELLCKLALSATRKGFLKPFRSLKTSITDALQYAVQYSAALDVHVLVREDSA